MGSPREASSGHPLSSAAEARSGHPASQSNGHSSGGTPGSCPSAGPSLQLLRALGPEDRLQLGRIAETHPVRCGASPQHDIKGRNMFQERAPALFVRASQECDMQGWQLLSPRETSFFAAVNLPMLDFHSSTGPEADFDSGMCLEHPAGFRHAKPVDRCIALRCLL